VWLFEQQLVLVFPAACCILWRAGAGASRNQKVEQNLMTCAAQQGDWRLALDVLDGPESDAGFYAVSSSTLYLILLGIIW